MEKPIHSITSLFDQLGLESSEQAIDAFVNANRPVPEGVELCKAPFWSPSQANFLKQMKADDADWAVIVDQLDVMLR